MVEDVNYKRIDFTKRKQMRDTFSTKSKITQTAGSLKYSFLDASETTWPTNSLTQEVLLSEIHSCTIRPDLASAPYANKRPKRESLASYNADEKQLKN